MKDSYRHRLTYRSLLILFAAVLALPLLARHTSPSHAQVGTNLVLTGAPLTPVEVGDSFTLTVEIQANGQPHDTVEVYLDFDKTILAVTGVAATAEVATNLPIELQSPAFDNTTGEIDYAAGTLGAPPNINYPLLNIDFVVLSDQNTSVDFSSTAPRQTAVFYSGSNVLTSATGATIEIVPVAVTLIATAAAGSARPPAGAALPLLLLASLSFALLWRRSVSRS